MTDAKNQDEQLLVFDLTDKAIIAGAEEIEQAEVPEDLELLADFGA